MALTDQQKSDIIFHLGWPGKTLVVDSTHFNKIAVDRMENLTPEIEARVTLILADIDAARVKIIAGQDRLSAKQVDTIILNDNEISLLKNDLRRLKKELSCLLDLKMLCKSGGANIRLCQ